MDAKLVFILGLVGIGGYIGHKASNFDPAVYPYSREQAQQMLVNAKTVVPRRDRDGEIKIWSVGRSAKGVSLRMQHASWSSVRSCEVVITEVAADKSRIVPDCGATATDSAIAQTQQALRVPMFEEHIMATLGNRPFNRDIVSQKEMAIAFKNMGSMQREALRTADEMQRLTAEANK